MIYELDGMRPELPQEGGYWVAPTATLIGKVRLKRDSSVWFGAVLRGDNDAIEIGARSNIQDNAMVHVDPGFPVTIGKGCTVGHHAILHGCSIGDHSLIGMGATVLNGARIGADCLVGANALVTEGKVFERGSLIVGAPARAIRKLDDAALAELRRPAENYLANWRRFTGGLVEIEG
ncbi:MAG TPA: gamma carbonic anhydrase family protein [Xanthobacteraceae bacterium]|jgi:carbonic anhydrase/acetyltransferase-like protein (isoleucine patch superfamily)|nr:gamma carbonic anhydrase family protein [Xanthobacteraceae bacterium]